MPKALRDVEICFFFLLAYSSCYCFNLIAFIISIETEASLFPWLNLYIKLNV